MKKFLYSTTALVGAAFLIGDVSSARADVMSGTDFTISGDARYRYVSSSADTQHEDGRRAFHLRDFARPCSHQRQAATTPTV